MSIIFRHVIMIVSFIRVPQKRMVLKIWISKHCEIGWVAVFSDQTLIWFVFDWISRVSALLP